MCLTKESKAIFASAENLPTYPPWLMLLLELVMPTLELVLMLMLNLVILMLHLVLVLTLDHDQKSERAGLNIWHSLAPQVLNRGGWATFAKI